MSDPNAPTVPTPGLVLDTLKRLEAEILAALEAVKSKLPAGIQPDVSLVETLLQTQFDNLGGVFNTLPSQILSEVRGLILSGRSAAPHDPTELA